MNTRLFAPALLLALASPALTAAEVDSSPWFAVSVGTSTIKDDDGMDEDQDRALSGALGWDFAEHLGMEFGLVDLGTFKSASVPAGEFSARSVTASLVPYLQMDRTRLYARAGIGFWSAKYESNDRTGTDPVAGIGVDYRIGESADMQWSLRADWTRHFTVGDKDKTGETDIDTLSLGVVLRY